MRNWEGLRITYLTNKAQSLTELATFGSVLLLVLSVLLKYGMEYNYQMDLNTRAFRQSMSDAYNTPRPEASSQVFIVEDKHIPDPADRFGVGNAVTVNAGSSFIWGNTLRPTEGIDMEPYPRSKLPRAKYMINAEPFTDSNGNGIWDGDEPLTCDPVDPSCIRDHDGDGILRRESFTDVNENGVWDYEPWDDTVVVNGRPDYETYPPLSFWPLYDPNYDGRYEVWCPDDNGYSPSGLTVLGWRNNGIWDHEFIDLNNNKVWDHERFEDVDEDGICDQDPFIDTNGNGIWNAGEAFDDLNGNGVYDGVKEYITAAYSNIWDENGGYGALRTAGIWTQILGRPKEFVTWDKLRIYKPEEPGETSFVPEQVMFLTSTNEIEILSEAAASNLTALRPVIAPLPVGGKHGDPVQGIMIRNPQSAMAEMNPEYFEENLNQDNFNDGNFDGNEDVKLEDLQGIIPGSDNATNRDDSISLEEGPTYLKSTDQVNAATTMMHTIKKNNGGLDIFPSSDIPVDKKINGLSGRLTSP